MEKLPDLIRRSVKAARDDLTRRYGDDPKNWKWGNERTLAFSNPLRRSGPGRAVFGTTPRAMDGSGETVMRARAPFMGNGEVDLFPSMRLIADLGDDEKVLGVVAGGTVERQFHRNQKDQLARWFEGDLLPWWFDRVAIEKHARHRQVLVPAPR